MKQNKRHDHVMIYYEIVFITFISRDSHRSMMPFDVLLQRVNPVDEAETRAKLGNFPQIRKPLLTWQTY